MTPDGVVPAVRLVRGREPGLPGFAPLEVLVGDREVEAERHAFDGREVVAVGRAAGLPARSRLGDGDGQRARDHVGCPVGPPGGEEGHVVGAVVGEDRGVGDRALELVLLGRPDPEVAVVQAGELEVEVASVASRRQGAGVEGDGRRVVAGVGRWRSPGCSR